MYKMFAIDEYLSCVPDPHSHFSQVLPWNLLQTPLPPVTILPKEHCLPTKMAGNALLGELSLAAEGFGVGSKEAPGKNESADREHSLSIHQWRTSYTLLFRARQCLNIIF